MKRDTRSLDSSSHRADFWGIRGARFKSLILSGVRVFWAKKDFLSGLKASGLGFKRLGFRELLLAAPMLIMLWFFGGEVGFLKKAQARRYDTV